MDAACLLLLHVFLVAVSATALPPPHLILVVLDDVGFADVSFNISSAPSSLPTPIMSRLASDGVVLTQFYTHPTCTPTRAALMTGRYSSATGLAFATMPGCVAGLPLDLLTLPQVLQSSAGYATHMQGKWHLGHAQLAQTPVGRGFDSFTGCLLSQQDVFTKQMHRPDGRPMAVDWMTAFANGTMRHHQDPRHATVAITEGSIEVMAEHSATAAKDTPLFLYVAFTAAHSPLQPLPSEERCNHIPHLWRRQFCGLVVGLDDAVGAIMAAARTHLGENTMSLVMSDNGGSTWFGGLNEPLRGGKTSPYEGGIRVPAFFLDLSEDGRYLGLRRPGSNDDTSSSSSSSASFLSFSGLAHAADVMPTFLALAGINASSNGQQPAIATDGFNLIPAIKAATTSSATRSIGGRGRRHWSPRSEALLDMYLPGESVWAGEGVIALRRGDLKLILGTPRDGLWYSTPTSDRLNSSDETWTAVVMETVVRLVDCAVGTSQADTLRALLTWNLAHNRYVNKTVFKTKELAMESERLTTAAPPPPPLSSLFSWSAQLYNLSSDEQERHDLAASRPTVVAQLTARAGELLSERPVAAAKYWMIVANLRSTLVDMNAAGAEACPLLDPESSDCVFIAPWVPDDADLDAVPSETTKAVVGRLIAKNMLAPVARAGLIAIAVAIAGRWALLLRRNCR